MSNIFGFRDNIRVRMGHGKHGKSWNLLFQFPGHPACRAFSYGIYFQKEIKKGSAHRVFPGLESLVSSSSEGHGKS